MGLQSELLSAIVEGDETVVALLLLAQRADDPAREYGGTPLYYACAYGHASIAARLLDAGADVDRVSVFGTPPLYIATRRGHLECVRLCCAYNARRTFDIRRFEWPAEDVAAATGQAAVARWLERTRDWSTRLHHLELLTEAQARKELRTGADLHASALVGGPTPLKIARALLARRDVDDATPGAAAARLVLRAARPWSPATHALCPAPARARAVELVRIGFLLSRAPRFAGAGPQAVMDVWRAFVMPHAVERWSGAGRADARQ